MTPLEYLLAAAGAALLLLLGAIAWFFRTTREDTKAGFLRNDQSNARVEGKVDALVNTMAATRENVVMQQLKVQNLDGRVSALEGWRDDARGWLVKQGMLERGAGWGKPRDGDGED